jgi:hypothetical protein
MAPGLAGCSSFRETHFFRQRTGEGTRPNYYRVRITARTSMSSARYTSGYFDEKAVERYFSEIKQPKDAPFEATVSPDPVEPLDPSLEGRSLVLLLSTNTEAITSQIGAITENDEMARTVANIARRDDFDRARHATLERERQRARAQSLVRLGEDLLLTLSDDADRETAAARLLDFFNAALVRLGEDRNFTSLTEAAEWYRSNRARVIGG